MGRNLAAPGFGALSLGTLSTASGSTSSWLALPGSYERFGLAVILSGSTGTITGTVILQGKLSTGGAAVTLLSWGAALGTGIAKRSTNAVPVTHVRIQSTAGLASTASTGTVAILAKGYLAAVP